jgi:hypothetical protein
MAFVQAPTWNVTFSFIDNNLNYATMSFNLPGTLDAAGAQAAATGLSAALVPISNAKLDKWVLSRSTYSDAPAPAAESEVERKLMLTFEDATGRFKSSIQVPSPVFTIEQYGTDAVNPANALVAAVVAAVTNGGVGGGNAAIAFSGADLVRLFGKPTVRHVGRKPQA